MAKIWAHRGASGYAPENTMEAFRLAQEMQADGFELDVHLTKDGQVVVTHDENIRRVTGVDALVQNLTLEQLKAIDFSNHMDAYKGAKIPTLTEVLDFMHTNSMTLNIELKTGENPYTGIEEKVLTLVKEAGMTSRVIYSSFNHWSLMKLRALAPDARIGLLYSEQLVDVYKYALSLHADAIHPWEKSLLVPGCAQDCLANGIEINCWTINTKESMQAMLALGCHALITNYPDIARAVVDGR